jgi:hypothetical protein
LTLSRLGRLVPLGLLAAGCAGHAGSATGVTGPTVAGTTYAPAPFLAGLFVDGARYRYQGQLESERDADAPTETRPVSVTCAVGSVRATDHAVSATLACDGEGEADLSTRLTASDVGLFRAADPEPPAGEPSDPARSELVLVATPVIGTVVVRNDDEARIEIETSREGRAICVEQRTLIGDETSWKLCLDGGRPVRLESSFEGASSRRLTLSLVEPPR